MQRSKAASMLITMVFLGLLGWAPSGCSSEDAAPVAPGTATPTSGFDDGPPAMPAGLCVEKTTNTAFALGWTASTDDDLAGYRVYVYDPSPYRSSSYRCPHGVDLIDPDATRYVYREDTSFGMHYFMLAAVDQNGNESMWYGPLELSFDGNPSNRVDQDVRGPNDFVPGPGAPPEGNPNGREEHDQD